MMIRETMLLCATVPPPSEVDVVNVTHSFRPYMVPVFANGLSEALHANGLSSSVRILRNFSTPDAEQQRLAAQLLRCADPPPDAIRNRTIVIEVGGGIFKLDAGCASTLVDSDRAVRPGTWDLLHSGQ